jgi:hypothetical protein
MHVCGLWECVNVGMWVCGDVDLRGRGDFMWISHPTMHGRHRFEKDADAWGF